MFHVMLVLPLLAAYGAVAFFILLAPFCLGGTLQLIFSIFSVKKWVLLLPAILGGIGAVVSMVCLMEIVSVPPLLIYWGIYFFALWLIWLIVVQIKGAIQRWRTKG